MSRALGSIRLILVLSLSALLFGGADTVRACDATKLTACAVSRVGYGTSNYMNTDGCRYSLTGQVSVTSNAAAPPTCPDGYPCGATQSVSECAEAHSSGILFTYWLAICSGHGGGQNTCDGGNPGLPTVVSFSDPFGGTVQNYPTAGHCRTITLDRNSCKDEHGSVTSLPAQNGHTVCCTFTIGTEDLPYNCVCASVGQE